MRIKLSLFFYILFTVLSLDGLALTSNFAKTKGKLKELDSQIVKLKENLLQTENKLGLIHKELALNEKEISQNIVKLLRLNLDILQKQKQIGKLQNNIKELNLQILEQQKLFASHLVLRYKMGSYTKSKMILNQKEPYALSRMLTLHQYLIHSRELIIAAIDKAKQELTTNEHELESALLNQQNLKQQLSSQQQLFEKSKNYNKALLDALSKDLQTKRTKMGKYQHDKQNLAELLKNLLNSNKIFAKPFSGMRHKLPAPLANPKSYQKMNQGIKFFAGEGTAVYAVHAGKVVFADWLNGYGLLVIIDHGQNFMTLYAHNQSIFLNKGSLVAQGQQIATVGHSGGIKQSGLYFEVRQSGKAIPPSEWLS